MRKQGRRGSYPHRFGSSVRAIVQGLGLCFMLSLAACAHKEKPTLGQNTPDEGFIRFEDPSPLGTEGEVLSEEANEKRESMRSELFTLESEISIKKGQLSHLVLLNDPIWESQRLVLEDEIRSLQRRRAHLEAALMVLN